jgi:glutamate-1-semialdehyde 2,1-aminomutase
MAFGVTNHFDGTPTPGVLPGVAEEIVLAPPGDADAVAGLLERGDVAAVIIEPTGASWGQVPVAPKFLAELRTLTRDAGTVLIFDEVISGFRCSPGGAQAVYGITPELTTLAKIVAGGLPGGALVGQAEIMEALDFAASQAAGRDKVPHQGTFNANPLSAAAGIATLEIVASTDACQQANDYAARLRDSLNAVIRDERLAWVVYGEFSGFHLFLNPQHLDVSAEDILAGRLDYRDIKSVPKSLVTSLRLGMLVAGVELFSWPGGPTSAVHTDADLQCTADALRQTIRRMREEGLV